MDIITHRRALHQIPEPDVRLPKTAAYLRGVLESYRCKLFSPIENSVCAYFDFGAARTIAFRADMDALPIHEQTGLPFASRHPGYMHACGHDGHMAIGLELARRLNECETFPNNVLLVFQPAEETIGGAQMLCRTGFLQEYAVEAIFALHLWPGQTAGTLSSRKNEMLSRCCELTVDIYGKPAHVARSWEARDATAAAMDFYAKAYALERSIDPGVRRLLKFGKMTSGTVRNIISGHARLEGTLRTYQDEWFDRLYQGILDIAGQVEAETGCRVEVKLETGYLAVINHPGLFDKVHKLMDFDILEEPSMISEDFSYYQREVPGVFFFLGLGDTPALHNDRFNFDESVLAKGADFFWDLANRYC